MKSREATKASGPGQFPAMSQRAGHSSQYRGDFKDSAGCLSLG